MNAKQREHTLKQVAFDVHFHPPNYMRITVPSLTQEFLEIGQTYLALRLSKILDFTAISWPMYPTEPEETVILYRLDYQLEINSSMYALASPKFPLFIDNSITYTGRTSRCTRQEVRHPKITLPYAVSTSVDVNIDPVTLRPKPIPEWWKQKYGPPHGGSQTHIPNRKRPARPQNGVLKQEHRVCFSDIDRNKHTHFSTYTRLCLDAIYEHASINEHDNDDWKMVRRGWVSKIQVAFKSDSKLGDILNIEFWKDVAERETFHFEIKNEARIIVIATFAFHHSVNDSNL